MALYPIELGIENIDPTPSTTANISSVTVGTTAVSILAANAERKGFSVYNNSNRKIRLGNTNAVTLTTGFFVIIPANTLYEWSGGSIYTGALFAIADGAGATCQISELTP